MRTLDYTIVFVADMRRSVKFYREVMGLGLKFESPEWSEMITGGCTLALHKSDGNTLSSKGWESGTCQLGFKVKDIAAFHKEVTGKGIRVLREPKQEEFGKLAVYADPDGLGISIMEMPEHK